MLSSSDMFKRQPSRGDSASSVSFPFDAIEYTPASPSWRPSLPHVCVAILSSVLFGYHIAVVNSTLQSIALDLGFAGHVLAEGWVVSTCLVGAFFGCAVSGSFADGLGRRRSFQVSTIPMVLGACASAVAPNLGAMLLGRFLVGLGIGLAGPVTSLYVSEISPTAVRGTYGGLLQIANCIGILGALVMGLPVATVPGWWRTCFWMSTIPAVLLAVGMEFCAESPRWLFKVLNCNHGGMNWNMRLRGCGGQPMLKQQ